MAPYVLGSFDALSTAYILLYCFQDATGQPERLSLGARSATVHRHAVTFSVGDTLRLHCAATMTSPASPNATFAWFFNGVAIPPKPLSGLYRYRIAQGHEAAAVLPNATAFSLLDMGSSRTVHSGLYTCQSIVTGTLVEERHFEVLVTEAQVDDSRSETISDPARGDAMEERSVAIMPGAFWTLGMRPEEGKQLRFWPSQLPASGKLLHHRSLYSALVGQDCDNDELCAQTDPVSLCESGQCICAPTYALEGTRCIKRVGRGQHCGQQAICRGSSLKCVEGVCECGAADRNGDVGASGVRHDECEGSDGGYTYFATIVLYVSMIIVVSGVVFIFCTYFFCQKRYDLDDQFQGAFIVNCVIL